MGRQATEKRARRGVTRHWTAAEARDVLGEWKTSGMPLGTFARLRGLNDTRLRWWKTRLGDWGGDVSPAHAPTFIRAVVRGAVETASTSALVTVRFPGGVVVEVADTASVPAKWLPAVVSGLSRAG